MGENYATKLGRLSAEQAFEKPFGCLHSAAALLSHVTAWRKDALLKIATGKGRLRDADQANWLPEYRLREIGWSRIVSDFDQSLNDVLELLESREDTFLEETYYDQDYGGEYPYSYLVLGLLHHDLYHLGQLGLVVKSVLEHPATP